MSFEILKISKQFKNTFTSLRHLVDDHKYKKKFNYIKCTLFAQRIVKNNNSNKNIFVFYNKYNFANGRQHNRSETFSLLFGLIIIIILLFACQPILVSHKILKDQKQNKLSSKLYAM